MVRTWKVSFYVLYIFTLSKCYPHIYKKIKIDVEVWRVIKYVKSLIFQMIRMLYKQKEEAFE